MEIKIKRTIAMLSVCLMVFTALSAVMVYAPQPDGVNTPFQNVVITNDETQPIPVNIIGTGPLNTRSEEFHESLMGEPVVCEFVTRGFRQITLDINLISDDTTVYVEWRTDEYPEGVIFAEEDFWFSLNALRVYDVKGAVLRLTFLPIGGEELLFIGAYLTA